MPGSETGTEWSDNRQGSCVAYIDIPEQAGDCLFVVAAPVGKPGTPSATTVAVPMREADGTHWLPRTEIQRLLSAGIAASGLPTGQALAELVRDAVASAPPPAPVIRVGQGAGDREREVREAYEQLRVAAGLGLAVSEAWFHGPAVVQEFDSSREGGAPGWVLCLVRGRAPVAVGAPVWQAVVDAGLPDVGGDPLAAVGYPIMPNGSLASGVLDVECRRVELAGGRRGPGLLLRSESGGWRWEPVVRFEYNQTRAISNWTSHQPPPQLRVRVLLNLPYEGDRDLQITPDRRQHLEQQLPFSALAGAATLLSQRRGADLRATVWEMGPYDNRAGSACYASTISAPDGRTALTAAVMIAAPNTMESNTITCAEILIQDAAAWAAALPPESDTRLRLDEVHHLLLAAWDTAARLLPDAVDASSRRWARPPTAELRLTAQGPNGMSPGLATLLDLTALGPNSRDIVPEMAITITAPPTMERSEGEGVLLRALTDMARHFGYVHTRETAFS